MTTTPSDSPTGAARTPSRDRGDRWHLWHGLGEAVRKEVAAHCACWAKGMPLQEGKRAAATLERWQQVRELRARNVGLLECARRLNLSLNTVKRYDRASEPQRLQRVPKYRPTLAGPHRDYLRKRRAEEPGVPVQQLLREIRAFTIYFDGRIPTP